MTVKGRPEQMKRLIKEGKTPTEIASIVGINRSNVYAYCRYHNIILPVRSPSGAYLTRTGRYDANVHIDHKTIYLGTFDDKRRAELCAALWKHWKKQGYKPWTIPTRPLTTSLMW